MMVEIDHPGCPLRLVFEDDGRVAYANLIRVSHGIVADVSIYNSVETPEAESLMAARNGPLARILE